MLFINKQHEDTLFGSCIFIVFHWNTVSTEISATSRRHLASLQIKSHLRHLLLQRIYL